MKSCKSSLWAYISGTFNSNENHDAVKPTLNLHNLSVTRSLKPYLEPDFEKASGIDVRHPDRLAGENMKPGISRHIELDAIFWKPNWVERNKDEFRQLVREAITENDQWIIDGNYSKERDITWPETSTIIWLNYSFPLVLWRTITRTTRRVVYREELFSGNKESFKKAFFSRDSII